MQAAKIVTSVSKDICMVLNHATVAAAPQHKVIEQPAVQLCRTHT